MIIKMSLSIGCQKMHKHRLSFLQASEKAGQEVSLREHASQLRASSGVWFLMFLSALVWIREQNSPSKEKKA